MNSNIEAFILKLISDTNSGKLNWKKVQVDKKNDLFEYEKQISKAFSTMVEGIRFVVYQKIVIDDFRDTTSYYYRVLIADEYFNLQTKYSMDEIENVNVELLYRLAERSSFNISKLFQSVSA